MFHKKIEKIQSDIDELLDLCAEANNTHEADEYDELGLMILMAQEGDLDEQGCEQLEKHLLENNKLLRYYADFQSLTAALCYEHNNNRFQKMLDAVDSHSASHSV